MKRLAFTITSKRDSKTIRSLRDLLVKDLFQGIEIFYPYEEDEGGIERYREDIRYVVNGLDIEVVMHLPFGKYNDLIGMDNVMLNFYNAIDFSREFNVKKFTLHLGTSYKEGSIDIACKNVRLLCDYVDIFGGFIMIENMPANNEVGTSLDELKYIIEKVDKKNLGFIYDTGHGHVFLKDTLKELDLLKGLRGYLMHMHISDNDSSKDAHGRIGSGNIEFDKIFSYLDDYDGLYCLEILYNNANDLKEYREDFLNIFKKS